MLLNIRSTGLTFKTYKFLKFCLRPSIPRSFTTASDIKTVDLSYKMYGNCGETSKQPPLVLFHGLLTSKNDWDGVGEEIHSRTGRQVISIDTRNHGDSGHSPDISYFHMVQDVVELLRKLKLSKISVLGHSMGGYNAMVLAITFPELVSSLAIEDISPNGFSPGAFKISTLMNAMAAMSIKTNIPMSEARAYADDTLKAISSDVNLRNHILENLATTTSGLYIWKVNLPILKKFAMSNDVYFPNILKSSQYCGPTLFIGGSKSDFLRKYDFSETKEIFPLAKLVYIKGAGHFIHRQKPKEFLDIVCKCIL